MVVLNDENMGIFESQHPPMPEDFHVLMQTRTLLIYRFYGIVALGRVGSCGATLREHLRVLVLVEQHHFYLTSINLILRSIQIEDKQ